MRPIETMRPCRTPTSARNPGRPEPSITVPFLITRSYGMGRPPWCGDRIVLQPERVGELRYRVVPAFPTAGQRVGAEGVQTTLTSVASRAAAEIGRAHV